MYEPHQGLPCRNKVILSKQSPLKRYVVLFYSSGGGGGSTAAIVIFSLIGAAVASCLIYYCCCKEKKPPKTPVLHVTMGQSFGNGILALVGRFPCAHSTRVFHRLLQSGLCARIFPLINVDRPKIKWRNVSDCRERAPEAHRPRWREAAPGWRACATVPCGTGGRRVAVPAAPTRC